MIRPAFLLGVAAALLAVWCLPAIDMTDAQGRPLTRRPLWLAIPAFLYRGDLHCRQCHRPRAAEDLYIYAPTGALFWPYVCLDCDRVLQAAAAAKG